MTSGLMIYNSCNSFVAQWLGKSTGTLVYYPYSGPATFVAHNDVQVPGRRRPALGISFSRRDGKSFAKVSLLHCMSLAL